MAYVCPICTERYPTQAKRDSCWTGHDPGPAHSYLGDNKRTNPEGHDQTDRRDAGE